MASSFLWHAQEIDSVVHEFKTDLEQGLSSKESASRLVTYGLNELPETGHISWVDILVRQQIGLMIPFLILSSVILFLSDMWSSASVVIGFLLVNIVLSGFQEFRYERLLASIKKFANRSIYAKILRGGQVRMSKATELVPGDVICFEAGDKIAADGRLFEADDLTIDESSIMRTYRVAEKDIDMLDGDAPIHQRANMVFMGTTVVNGSGKAVVTSTGTQTQIARISAASSEVKGERWSLLKANLEGQGIWFAGGCIACSVLLWLIMMLFGASPITGALISIGFLMAAWPMGLMENAIMALAIGMKRLSERDIAIQKFSGAEALAEATVICSDKAGIMTQEQMIVKRIFVDGRIIDVDGEGYDPESGIFPPDVEEENPDLPFLLTVASMCTNTEVKDTPEGWDVIGDPTEGALIVAAMKGEISKDELGLSLTRIGEIPYDSERKRMTIIYESSKDEFFAFTKGAFETLLDISSNFQLNGYVDDLDIGRQRAIWAVNKSFARDGMESMAFAYRKLNYEPEEYTVEAIEHDMVFIGMMGIVDPFRPDAESAMQKCLAGAVHPIMLTDDHVDTAVAIAYDLGMIKDGSEVLAGEELDILGEKEYSGLAERFSAYADVSSSQKIRIIHTLKEKGEVIALIGGHNSSAPIMAEADIGILAGQTGTSAVNDASDMVLMDNSFATAVNAIETMRGAYGNSKKIIRYLLSGSVATVGTILLILLVSIFRRGFPLISPPQMLIPYILWINLLGGIIPAFAMIFSPATDGVMREGPYLRGKIFDDGLWTKILIRGVLTAFLAFIAFAFCLSSQDTQNRAITATLTVLIVSQIAFAFQCRSTPGEGFFRRYLTSKPLLILAAAVILLNISIIYIPPISQFLGTSALLLLDWIPILVAFVICSLPLDELFRTRAEEKTEEEDDSEERQMEPVETDTFADSNLEDENVIE